MSRVLVVEDEPVVRRAVVRALSQEGFEVHATDTAREAVGLVSALPSVECAVLDLELPDASGINLADALARTGKVARMLFFSGAADPELLAEAAARAPFVSKSDGISLLAARVAYEIQSLGDSQRHPSFGTPPQPLKSHR